MVEIIRRQSDPLLARVEQPRPYYHDDSFMAVYIAAHRLVGALSWSYNRMYAKLQDEGYGYVDDRKIRYWAQQQPDLPELLIRMGEMTPEDFPAFLRPFLRTENGLAPMAQERTSTSRSGDDLALTFADAIKAGVVVVVAAKLLDWLFSPRPQSVSSNGVTPAPRIGRVSRKRGLMRSNRRR